MVINPSRDPILYGVKEGARGFCTG